MSPTRHPLVRGAQPRHTPTVFQQSTYSPDQTFRWMGGLGSQTGQNLNRWGDYSSLTVDPTDDTFWYTTKYLRTRGAFNWSTQIASFKFPGCS